VIIDRLLRVHPEKDMSTPSQKYQTKLHHDRCTSVVGIAIIVVVVVGWLGDDELGSNAIDRFCILVLGRNTLGGHRMRFGEIDILGESKTLQSLDPIRPHAA